MTTSKTYRLNQGVEHVQEEDDDDDDAINVSKTPAMEIPTGNEDKGKLQEESSQRFLESYLLKSNQIFAVVNLVLAFLLTYMMLPVYFDKKLEGVTIPPRETNSCTSLMMVKG